MPISGVRVEPAPASDVLASVFPGELLSERPGDLFGELELALLAGEAFGPALYDTPRVLGFGCEGRTGGRDQVLEDRECGGIVPAVRLREHVDDERQGGAAGAAGAGVPAG